MWIDALAATIDKDRIGTHWEECYLQHRDCAILRLIAVARAGRRLEKTGQAMLDATVEGNIKLGHQKHLNAALAAFREAERG